MYIKKLLIVGSLFLVANHGHSDKASMILSGAVLGNGPIKSNGSNKSDNDLNYGFAALIEANINGQIGIESGLLWSQKRYVGEFAGFQATSTVNRLHVPISLRFWPTDFISFAAGPYAAFKVGRRSTEIESGAGSMSIQSSADDSVELGVLAAATVNIAFYKKFGVFAEGRFLAPLNTKDEEDAKEFMALIGIKLDL